MKTPPEIRRDITGAILAGGRATRMGGQDKGLIAVAGRLLIDTVISALRPQVSDLLINANRNLDRYRGCGLPVVTDLLEGYCGPLAGMASAMRVAKTPYILSVPCDSPLVAPDLAVRLHQGIEDNDAEIAVADSGGRLEPVFALIGCGLLPSLLAYLQSGERKIDHWYAMHRMAAVDLSDRAEMFLNLNTPQDVAAVEARLAANA